MRWKTSKRFAMMGLAVGLMTMAGRADAQSGKPVVVPVISECSGHCLGDVADEPSPVRTAKTD